jgi:hypothetical protein
MVTRKKDATEPNASESPELTEEALEHVTGGSSKPKEIVVVGSKIKVATKDDSSLGGNRSDDTRLVLDLLNGN